MSNFPINFWPTDSSSDSRFLDFVTIGAKIHEADANKMVVYRGTYGRKPIIARHYMNDRFSRNDTLVPLVLRENDLTHVLSYLGVAVVDRLVFYIFENYKFLLPGSGLPLVDANGRMSSCSKQILTCVLNGIQELRNVHSNHLLLEACNVAITSHDQITGLIQAKLIVHEGGVQDPSSANNATDQCDIDISSIATIFNCCVPNGYPEADDIRHRLNITNVPRKFWNDLVMAFTQDARMFLRHPIFWSPPQIMLFVYKISETIQKIKNIKNKQLMVTRFLTPIRATQIQNWHQVLPQSIQHAVVGMNPLDPVDFVIAMRNIDIHLVMNALQTQKDIKQAWTNFLSVNPSYLITCYNVAESFFGRTSIHTLNGLGKWIIDTNYDEFLILPK